MRECLVIHMVNISKVATNHKISDQQSLAYFSNNDVTIKHILPVDKLTEPKTSSVLSSTSTLASINARKNRQRIVGFTKQDGSDKYKG